MPKPARINRPYEKKINLPTDLVARVDLHLYSDLEARVPFGAWSKLVERLLTEYLATIKETGNEKPL